MFKTVNAPCPNPPVLSLDRLRSANALVVGMERSGVGSTELLVRLGAKVSATDLKPVEKIPAGVTFQLQSPKVFENRDLIVISPGVPCDLEPLTLARSQGAAVIGEAELASYFLKGRTIGITGSNGKTTTTALIGHILRENRVPVQVGGNIGTAVTALIDTSRDGQWNVLELSSFQLETISHFRAEIAVCLNVTPDHLDRHHTFQIYAGAKRRLFETQTSADHAVLNADDETCRTFAAHTPALPFWFSTRTGAATVRGGWITVDDRELIRLDEIPIRGMHNVENTLAAVAAAKLAGVPLDRIAASIRTFRAVEHRLEFVRTVSGVHFYNDSKATNVDAALKALDSFPGGLWVILGGKDKGSDYTVLREPLAAKAKGVLLIGAAAPKIREQIGAAVPVHDSGVIDAAVRDAYVQAQDGETVLLAPACASFDQFTGYEHRGRVFKEIVQSLEEKR
jgi:UDP-N-acetylmuramoylalanine--D-glutamate ligase